jgi:hypothetical protein
MLTPNQAKLVLLDRRKEEVKQFFEEYKAAIEALVAEHGPNHAFQDDQGVVYQLVELDGKWVNFERFGVERTRRAGEARGSLSIKKAKELGFNVKE